MAREPAHEIIWKNQKDNLKSAIISLDQSSAYDLVNHKLLLIKLKKILNKQAIPKRYGVILLFTMRWLEGRVVFWGDRRAVVSRGLPQGSSLSPILFVIFYDFSDEREFSDLEQYFADDSGYVITGKSWTEVEDKIAKLQQKFQLWCEHNGQRINMPKSTICFVRRKSAVSASFPFKEYVCDTFRYLGVYIDAGFYFTRHCEHIRKWVAARVCVLKLLKAVGISSHVLFRVIQTYRTKILFGTYWLLAASETLLTGLETSFSQCVRAAAGFTSLVPASVASKFCGFDKLRIYLKYWLGSRSADAYLKDNFDIVGVFEEEKKQERSVQSRYMLRGTTVEKTADVWRERMTIFPKSALRQIEDFVHIRKEGIKIFSKMGCHYKVGLKKKFVSCLIHKKTKIENAVGQINERYKIEILG